MRVHMSSTNCDWLLDDPQDCVRGSCRSGLKTGVAPQDTWMQIGPISRKNPMLLLVARDIGDFISRTAMNALFLVIRRKAGIPFRFASRRRIAERRGAKC